MHTQPTYPSFAASLHESPMQKEPLYSINQPSENNSSHLESCSQGPIQVPESFTSSTFEEHWIDDPKCEKRLGANIKVFCRFRPADKPPADLRYDTSMLQDKQNSYSFDAIFGKYASQKEIYQMVTRRHLQDFFNGLNSTVFAYGQTGSGKTHTMFGDMRVPEHFGIIPRALEEIFSRVKAEEQITCSMLEIYNQRLIDLFNPLQNQEEIKFKEYQNSVYLEGLIEVSVETKEELLTLIRLGHRGRKTAATYNNDCSSRSHTVLFVYRTFPVDNSFDKCKIVFIDLAGSEKVRKSGVQGQTLQEAKKINLSLSCLGNVVHALTNFSDHVPYRDSKLTRILKDSLSGDTKTSIVTTCSLNRSDYSETISTVKFAVRAKRIRNKPRLNNQQITMEQTLQQLKKELAQTKRQLNWYKEKEKMDESMVQIPQELVTYQPMKSMILSGVGICSRVQTINSSSVKQLFSLQE